MLINKYEELRESILQAYQKGLAIGEALHIFINRGMAEWIKICSLSINNLEHTIKNSAGNNMGMNTISDGLIILIANMVINFKKGGNITC